MAWSRARVAVVSIATIVLVVLLVAPRVHPPDGPTLDARDRVVAMDGSDAAAGTLDAPWRTLQHALLQVDPGGIVWVRSGRHAGFRLERSGTPEAPLTVAAWPGDPMPVIDGALDGRADVILLRGVQDVRVEGLMVTGSQGQGFEGSGVRVEGGSARVALGGLVVADNPVVGISVRDSVEVRIEGNELRYNAGGVRISHAGAGTVVRDNRIHHTDRMLRDTPQAGDDAGGDGITLDGTTGPILVQGNQLWANRAPSTDYGWDGGAFAIYGASGVTIMDNVAWDNENVLETGTDPGGTCAGNRFLRNTATGGDGEVPYGGLFLRCAEGMLVAHNTLRDLDFGYAVGADSASYSGSVEGLRILNDIVDLQASQGTLFGLFTPLPDNVTIDHSLVRTSGVVGRWTDGETDGFAAFQGFTGFQANGTWGDPRFMGPEGPDVAPGSPAIDAAVPIAGINDGWAGAGPDIGAAEHDAGP